MNLEKTTRIKTVVVLLLFGINFSIFAQEGSTGINTLTPNAAAALEVFSTSKGFLPPRLTTIQRDSINPKPAGLMIYNIDLNCIQYWNETKWIGQCSNFAGGLFEDCSAGIVSGFFGKDVVMTAENTLTVSVIVTELGPWSAFSEVVNGISFSGSGIFNSEGKQNITLTATGTAIADGDFGFVLNMDTSVCTKVITFIAPPPGPDLTASRTGLRLAYTSDGSIIKGTVSGLPVSATFSSFANISAINYTGTECGVNVLPDVWRLGSKETPSSMTIKFNRSVSNLKVFQNAISNKESVSYVLKLNGVVVPGKIQLSTAYRQNCNNNFEVIGTKITNITFLVSGSIGALYNVGDTWFDEITIIHNGEGMGSTFGFYLGSAK